MSGKKGPYKLLLQSVDPSNAAGIREIVQNLLEVGRGQANDIVESAPIILLDGITSRKKADRIRKKFKEAIDLGAEMKVSDEPLEQTPRLRWPEDPEIARDGEPEKAEGKEEEVLTLAKYNFVVDRRDVFRCPHCDKLFAITALSQDESLEAAAQAQIAERLQKQDVPQGAGPQAQVDQVEQTAPEPAGPKQSEREIPGLAQKPVGAQQSQPAAAPARGVEEMEPIHESKPSAGMLSSPDPEMIDLATFEEGLSSIEYEGPEVPELALPPDSEVPAPEQQAASPEQAQDFFHELENLPVEGQVGEGQVQEPPSPEAVQKESELEELAPDEAMAFLQDRRAKDGEEEQPEEGKKKIMAPRRGAGRRRMQRLRDKQEDKEGKRRPSGRHKRRKMEEKEEEAPPAEEVGHTEGFYGIVLQRIGTRDKKNKAARLIVELTGMHPEDARDICEGMFVKVLSGISEEEANEIAARFKELSIATKVTQQKRKMRKSGRMQRGRK